MNLSREKKIAMMEMATYADWALYAMMASLFFVWAVGFLTQGSNEHVNAEIYVLPAFMLALRIRMIIRGIRIDALKK